MKHNKLKTCVIIGSGNDVSHVRQQAITESKADGLLIWSL